MSKTRFIGARMEEEVYKIIDKVAKEEKLDKTSAMKILVQEGWKGLRLKKTLFKYQQGLISVDKAATLSGINVNEMMKAIVSYGIKSEETLEEYKKGIKILTKNN